MEFIKKITSPLRKHNVYSSQRHLVDTEASSNNENDTDEENEVSTNGRHKKDSNENNKKILKSPKTSPSYNLQRESFEMKSTDINNILDSSNSVDVSLKDKKHLSNNSSRRISLESLNEGNKSDVVFFKETTIPNSSRSESSSIQLNNLGDRPHSSHNSSHKSNRESNIRKPKRNEKASDKVKTNAQILSPETINKTIGETELKPLQKITDETNVGKILKIIGIHIHKCDILRHHPFLIYPFVKIYIVNLENGKCFNIENQKNIQINTKSFDFSKHRTIIPQWNELILFEDNIIEEIRNVLSIIIFFEIVGVQPHNKTNKEPETPHTIAWGFIKPFGNGEICNINRKIKIQLYEMLEINYSISDPKAYDCWKEKPWKVYPSILYVTLKGIKIHEETTINNMKLNIFKSKTNEQEINTFVNTQVKADTKFVKREVGQLCKIPNKIVKYLLNKEKGSFVIKFSHCGEKLAHSSGDHDDFSVHVYKVPQFTREAKLIFHKKFIYDICWSHSSNSILVTASADSTVCIWNLDSSQNNFLQQLVHPTFVYSSQFCTLDETIVTGCYDKIIRIWIKHKDKDYSLDQELLGHEGFINSICFGNKSKVFYSGDSAGLIIKWTNNKLNWCKLLIIKLSEIRDHVINDLVMFPDNQRMLVVVRNSVSWLLNVSTSTLLLCYKDGFEYTYQLRGSISPCGTLVFIGNCVWSASTGKLMAIYNPSAFNHQTITALDYHPYYNIFTMGCGFFPSPLIVCEFQENQQDSNMNIELFTDSSYSVNEESRANIYCDVGTNSDKIMQKMKQFPDLKASSFRRKLADQAGIDNKLIERIHDSKLWNLINKMDDVLLIARKGREYAENKSNALNAEDNIYQGTYKSNHISSESENNITISVDLTQFNEIFQLQADIHKPPTETNSDSKSECTYIVDRHDGDNIKEIVDDSSTLSAAESLEDDLHTYTISLNAENVLKTGQ